MLKLIQALNSLLGMLLVLIAAVLLIAGGWYAFRNYYAEKFELEADLAAKQEQLDRLARTDQQPERIGRLEKDLEQKRQEFQRLATR